MNREDRLFPEVMEDLSRWGDGGDQPDPGKVLDALIQEEVLRRRVADRLEAVRDADQDDPLRRRDVESLETRLDDAEDRVETLHRLRTLLLRGGEEGLDEAADALRELRTEMKIYDEDLEDLGHAAGTGGPT